MSSWLINGITSNVPVINALDAEIMRFNAESTVAREQLQDSADAVKLIEQSLVHLGITSEASAKISLLLHHVSMLSPTGTLKQVKAKRGQIASAVLEASRIRTDIEARLNRTQMQLMTRSLQEGFSFTDPGNFAGASAQAADGKENRQINHEKVTLTREQNIALNESLRERLRLLSVSSHSRSLQTEAKKALEIPCDITPENLRVLVESLENRNRETEAEYLALRKRFANANAEYEYLTGAPFTPIDTDGAYIILTEALCSYLESTVIQLKKRSKKEQTIESVRHLLNDMGMNVTAQREDGRELLFELNKNKDVMGSVSLNPANGHLVFSTCTLQEDEPDQAEIRNARNILCSLAFGRRFTELMPRYGLQFRDTSLQHEPDAIIQKKNPDRYTAEFSRATAMNGTIAFSDDQSAQKTMASTAKHKGKRMFIE